MAAPTHDPNRRKRQALVERLALADLHRVREPLHKELLKIRSSERGTSEPPHLCCSRPRNQMRISPLEAEDIRRAFQDDPELQAELPLVLRRIEEEESKLEDSEERQSFDCPLLKGKRCLVHDLAKPIGCLAWNPGRDYSKTAWSAFRVRDELNDRVYGPSWKLRVIPLWLRRLLFGHKPKRRSPPTRAPRAKPRR